MKTFAIVIGGAGVLAAAVVAFPGASAAAPSGPGSAGDVVQGLKDQGYNVMLNGTPDGPLSGCTVTEVHNPDSSGRGMQFTTVYVDVSCPRTDN